MVKIVSGAAVLLWFGAAWAFFALGIDAFGYVVVLPILVLSLSRAVDHHRRAAGWWFLKSAWLGDRARPSRQLVASVERYEAWRQDTERGRSAREAAEEQDDRAAVERTRLRAALGSWIQDGLAPSAAPRPDLVATGAGPRELQLTVGETDALIGLTGARGQFGYAEVFLSPDSSDEEFAAFAAARDARRASIVERLLRRGVLRSGPDGPELAPQWLPLVGVALFPSRSVNFSWQVDGRIEAYRALMVPGHTVEQRCTADAAGGSDEAEERVREELIRDADRYEHQLRQSTPTAVVDRAIAGLPALDTPLPSGEPNWMLVAVSPGDYWVVERSDAEYSVKLLGGEPAPGQSSLAVPELRDWMLHTVSP